jgi:hypothetical protein
MTAVFGILSDLPGFRVRDVLLGTEGSGGENGPKRERERFGSASIQSIALRAQLVRLTSRMVKIFMRRGCST